MNYQCNNKRFSQITSTKSKILNKAWELFSNASFFNLSMREIAQTLGLAKSALYYHFTNKTDLFRQVIDNRLSAFRSKFDTVVDRKLNATQKLKKLSTVYVKEVDQEKRLIRLIYSDLPSFDRSIKNKINEFRSELVNKLACVIKEGINQGEFRKNTDPYSTAIFLLNSMENPAINKNINKNNLTNQAIKILLHGIQKSQV